MKLLTTSTRFEKRKNRKREREREREEKNEFVGGIHLPKKK
jgi:hypothetical protein